LYVNSTVVRHVLLPAWYNRARVAVTLVPPIVNPSAGRKVILEQPKCVLMRAKRGRRARLRCAPGLLLFDLSGLAGSAAELQLEAENGSTRSLKGPTSFHSARSRSIRSLLVLSTVNDLTSPPSSRIFHMGGGTQAFSAARARAKLIPTAAQVTSATASAQETFLQVFAEVTFPAALSH
jgi:hypothetical protein